MRVVDQYLSRAVYVFGLHNHIGSYDVCNKCILFTHIVHGSYVLP